MPAKHRDRVASRPDTQRPVQDKRLIGGPDMARVGPDPRDLQVLIPGAGWKRFGDCTPAETLALANAYHRVAQASLNLVRVMKNQNAAHVVDVAHLTVQTIYQDECKEMAAATAREKREATPQPAPQRHAS